MTRFLLCLIVLIFVFSMGTVTGREMMDLKRRTLLLGEQERYQIYQAGYHAGYEEYEAVMFMQKATPMQFKRWVGMVHTNIEEFGALKLNEMSWAPKVAAKYKPHGPQTKLHVYEESELRLPEYND